MEEIIRTISQKGFHSSREVLSNFASDDWLKYVTINPNHYHRSKVFENDDFEIIIITWNKKQGSQIHNHAFNGCYMLMLQGELHEELFDENLTLKNSRIVKVGDVTFIDDKIGYHRIKNLSCETSAISLHVYSPPNHEVNLIG